MELKHWNYIFPGEGVRTFNRTLWNWNLWRFIHHLLVVQLLIVPYGIETQNWNQTQGQSGAFNRTLWNWNNLKHLFYQHFINLLIVPYGIETQKTITLTRAEQTFNRTLWNWNHGGRCNRCNQRTFNRTLWNWNYCNARVCYTHYKLLIVPYGIETPYIPLW